MLARLAYAVLAGIIAFIVVFIIGVVAAHFDASVGAVIEKFAGLIGLLVGVLYFFARPVNPSAPLV